MRRAFWWLDTRLRLRVRGEAALMGSARLLPRAVRRAVIVNAAVAYREPDRQAGDRYCGPDGISYSDLWRSA
jgi:hypothetical protein